jgi:hypothetical protein
VGREAGPSCRIHAVVVNRLLCRHHLLLFDFNLFLNLLS